MMEIELSHLIGDLNLKMPSSVYSSGSSTEGVGVVAFSDSFVTCCTLLLLSLNTSRLTVTLFLLSPMLSGCEASSRTVCAWCIVTVSLSCSQKSLMLALKFNWSFRNRLSKSKLIKLWSYESDKLLRCEISQPQIIVFFYSGDDEKRKFKLLFAELNLCRNNKTLQKSLARALLKLF